MKQLIDKLAQNTPDTFQVPEWVTITYRHGPHCGQKVKLVRFKAEDNALVTVELPDGARVQLPTSWTDLAHSDGKDDSEFPHLLDINGLRLMSKIIRGKSDDALSPTTARDSKVYPEPGEAVQMKDVKRVETGSQRSLFH